MTLFQDFIITDPAILGGKPVIKGTRLPVALIVEEIAGGMLIEEVTKQYELTREQVLAALQYAAALVREDAVFAQGKMMRRVVLDENLPRDFAAAFKTCGYEVFDVRDHGLRGAPDGAIFDFVSAQKAILATSE